MKNKIISTLIISIILIVGCIYIYTVIHNYYINNQNNESSSNKASIKSDNNETIVQVDDDSSIKIVKEFDESMFKGHKSLVFFWASWCSHCQEEYEVVKTAISDYQNRGYSIYVVSHDYDVDELADFMKNNDFNYEVYFDEERLIRAHFDPTASSVPLTYIIDENVNLIDSFDGTISLDELNNLIDKNM